MTIINQLVAESFAFMSDKNSFQHSDQFFIYDTYFYCYSESFALIFSRFGASWSISWSSVFYVSLFIIFYLTCFLSMPVFSCPPNLNKIWTTSSLCLKLYENWYTSSITMAIIGFSPGDTALRKTFNASLRS